MNDRLEQARRLGSRIGAGWRREDIEAQLARLHGTRQRRARRRVAAVPLVIAIAAGIVVGLRTRRELPIELPVLAEPEVVAELPSHEEREVVVAPAPVVEPPAPPSGVLSLGDGSVVTPLGKDSRLLARRVSETEVIVALAAGGAHFDVPERRTRQFRADLGALALETHGAAFRVQIARRQVEVATERGEVSARWGHERRVVGAGEIRTFPVAAHEEVAPVVPDGRVEPAPAPAPEPEPTRTWRDDAARGDYQAAWTALGTQAATDSMADLLLAGDVARMSGHPEAAVTSLMRAVAIHPEDARAPLAAFTLGRVYLEDLGSPRDAALAFEHTIELAPDGPLAEDALAREAEAWSRGGEIEAARMRARAYLQRYPHGRRAQAVRQFGGLEGP